MQIRNRLTLLLIGLLPALGADCPFGAGNPVPISDVYGVNLITDLAGCFDVGTTSQLSVLVTDSTGATTLLPFSPGVRFSSDNDSIASVSATGLVTGHAPGDATISVSDAGATIQITIPIAADDDNDGILNCDEACDGAAPSPGDPVMTETEQRVAEEVFNEINAQRISIGLPPLHWHAASARVASMHTWAMEQQDFWSHINPYTHLDQSQRAAAAGIEHDPDNFISLESGAPYVGEALFRGVVAELTGERIVSSLLNSDEHRGQLLAPIPTPGEPELPAWTHCGVGVRYDGLRVWVAAMFFKNPNCAN